MIVPIEVDTDFAAVDAVATGVGQVLCAQS